MPHASRPTVPVALLIVDVINDFRFEEGRATLEAALPMAERIRALKRRARRAAVPSIYVNDNFGRWRSDFRSLVARCLRAGSRASRVAKSLRPHGTDYFVLKPRHSAFFSTPLELLLEHLGARSLILTGLLTDSCILFTAQDAYLRGYKIVVPHDCVCARTPQDQRRALDHLRRALKADVRASHEINLGRPTTRRP
jgi:nicotinamidase-related amidase